MIIGTDGVSLSAKNKLIFGAQNFSIKPLSDSFSNQIYLDVFVSKSSLSAL